MECQVNVAQGTGERIEGDYKGRRWHAWTDGLTTWKSFRIPYGAATKPHYDDPVMMYDLDQHAEGIGMTGWNWEEQVSEWVAYDFDSIVGHSDKHTKKLTNAELKEVEQEACKIDWVTVRRSTSGKGLHLYVELVNIPTSNHHEHAALARSILGMMSALVGFDFSSKVDICGGNMWVWHRKMKGTQGLTMIKEGIQLQEPPRNWRDHIKVVTHKRRKNLPQNIEDSGREEDFTELSGQRTHAPLDEDHKKLIQWLRERNALWWWDQDHHMLVTHTVWLARAHEALEFKGIYQTTSTGLDLDEQNCFAFPLRRGAWTVRRYSQGASEHESWIQDSNGWTRCYYNRMPDIQVACHAFGGMEDPSGGWVFRHANDAASAAEALGVVLNIGAQQAGRKAKIKKHRDKRRIVIEIKHEGHDSGSEMQGWLLKKDQWTIIETPVTSSVAEPDDIGNFDDLVRHLVSPTDEDTGWMVQSNNSWRSEPLTHVKSVLSFMGYSDTEIKQIIGSTVLKAWKDVNKPFEPEYTGNREWNRSAAQLKFKPTEDDKLSFDHWKKILEHCGQGLDDAVAHHPWCRTNGILTGAEYLMCWVASVFQHPTEPLPYLFFYGPQNSGKSIFHEALHLLLTKGYKRADQALMNGSGFNGELEGAIICVVEETNLKQDKQAYNRIKDWVTSLEILLHVKGKTPYHIVNTTHWVQCANHHTYCPIFTGDTRIIMCFVPTLDPFDMIPKRKMLTLLNKEAPDFLAHIMRIELPESPDRLNIPPIVTQDKQIAEQLNKTSLESFLDEHCRSAAGHLIRFSDFHARFMEWIEPAEVRNWGKIKTGKELPPQYPKARVRGTSQVTIGNIAWKDSENLESRSKVVVRDGYLEACL